MGNIPAQKHRYDEWFTDNWDSRHQCKKLIRVHIELLLVHENKKAKWLSNWQIRERHKTHEIWNSDVLFYRACVDQDWVKANKLMDNGATCDYIEDGESNILFASTAYNLVMIGGPENIRQKMKRLFPEEADKDLATTSLLYRKRMRNVINQLEKAHGLVDWLIDWKKQLNCKNDHQRRLDLWLLIACSRKQSSYGEQLEPLFPASVMVLIQKGATADFTDENGLTAVNMIIYNDEQLNKKNKYNLKTEAMVMLKKFPSVTYRLRIQSNYNTGILYTIRRGIYFNDIALQIILCNPHPIYFMFKEYLDNNLEAVLDVLNTDGKIIETVKTDFGYIRNNHLFYRGDIAKLLKICDEKYGIDLIPVLTEILGNTTKMLKHFYGVIVLASKLGLSRSFFLIRE